MCKALIDIAKIPHEDKARLLNLRFYDLVWVMLKLNIINSEISTDLDNIRKIGNNFIHPEEDINPSFDSVNVISSLGRLINRTSSIFNEYEIIQGRLSRKRNN